MHVKRLGRTTFCRLLRDSSGLSNIEYGLLLSFLAVTSVGALEALGVSISDGFTGTGEMVAQNREAFNSPTSGTPDGDTQRNTGDGTADPHGSAPDEPPVAGDMPFNDPLDADFEVTTPDEPPMAAMKTPDGS